MKKVLVTGHLGYIGVHLVSLLKKMGHHVVGCDLDLFEGCAFEPFLRPNQEWIRDIRTITESDLEGFDTVIHLAAISNDPMGDLDPELTFSINQEGTIQFARAAKNAGVSQFLFASSCSIYGKGTTLDIDEQGEVAPITPYAISKIEAEKELENLSSETFQTVSLRNATAYGYSPMLRIDLVVNNLLACAFTRGDIRVMSDGSPWRPLIHCKDIARAFCAFLETPPKEACLVVNVGGNEENYQVKEIVHKVHQKMPNTQVVFTGEVGADPRNYRVNFDRLKTVLPHFKLEYTLDKGIEELFNKYQSCKFCLEDFEGDKFVRLRTLKKRLEKVSSYAIS